MVNFCGDTHILIEGVGSVMSEEPRGDGSHISLGGVRHGAQTGQVDLVGLNGANEVAKDWGAETSGIGETSANGLEETGGFVGG